MLRPIIAQTQIHHKDNSFLLMLYNNHALRIVEGHANGTYFHFNPAHCERYQLHPDKSARLYHNHQWDIPLAKQYIEAYLIAKQIRPCAQAEN